MKQLFLSFIRIYQKYLNSNNPFLRTLYLTDRVCRFRPTCSEYAYQSINKHGIIKGLFSALLRIFRCHPWSKGGLDPVK